MAKRDEAAPIFITERQTATVLAALRYWQEKMLTGASSDYRDVLKWAFDQMPEHFDYYTPLDSGEINELCESIDLGEDDA